MIDISKVKYRLVAVDEKGKKFNVTDFITNLSWEETEKEISARISFTVFNKKTEKGRISSIIKLGTLIIIFASAGGKEQEVIRGYVVDWNPSFSESYEKFSCKAYDNLYNFQSSQDNVYYSSGISTQSAITKLFSKWGIKMGEYKGPNITHGKLKYQNDSLSDIVIDILKEAKKKGGKKCFPRANKGKVDIIPYGANSLVYQFESAENVVSIEHSMSTSNLVTRVKIVGQSTKKKQGKVEAVLNGQTKKYGIRQKLVIRSKSDKLADAKKEAQDILDEQGYPESSINATLPDIPFVRKGDLIYIKAGTLNNYYYAKSVRHQVDSGEMDLELKKANKTMVSSNKVTNKNSYKVGDIVHFKGGMHYISSEKSSKGYSVDAGKAKITIIKQGAAHPYHLIHVDNTSKVYGWVDEGTF